MLKNISNALGITVEHTAPPVQPPANQKFKMAELLRDSERTQPASNIAKWPVDQLCRIVDRARADLVSAEIAVERCQLHLEECQKVVNAKMTDLASVQNKLLAELRDCGCFDRRGDLPAWMREALLPVEPSE